MTEGDPVEGVVAKITGNKFEIPLEAIETAYRIKYKTKITEYSEAGYTNEAILKENGVKEAESIVTIGKIEQGSILEKRAIEPKKNDTKITWEIDVNQAEEDLKNVVVDDIPVTEGLTIDKSSIKIYKLEKNGSDWVQGEEDITEEFDV